MSRELLFLIHNWQWLFSAACFGVVGLIGAAVYYFLKRKK